MPINFLIKLGVTIAAEALQVGLQASQRTYGPRLDELSVTTADYGTPIPRFLGERKFACPIFHAEDLKEVEKTTKVKGGGKQTTYHYLATFACAIADNAIDKVLKVYFDDKLVYDATATGPISAASSLGIDLNSVMRIYKGTETQLPDPRYVTYCEDKYGANSAPAYRGVSYLFFEELPVDNFGNRIPQISVIATASANTSYPYDTKTTQQTNDAAFAFNASGNTLGIWANGTAKVEWWDVPTRTRLGFGQQTDASLSTINTAMANDGTAYQYAYSLTGNNVYLYVISQLGGWTKTLVTGWASAFMENPRVFDTPTGLRYTFIAYQTNAGYISGTTHVAHAQSARDFCIDDAGQPWAIFQPTGSSSAFTIQNLNTGASHTFTGSSRSGPGYATIAYVAQYGHFVVGCDNIGYIIDKATWTQTTSAACSFNSLPNNNAEQKTDVSTIWDLPGGNFAQYSLKDGSLVNSFTRSSWASLSTTSAWAFDPVNHAIWELQNSGTGIYIFYLERATNAGTTLGAIISKMCDAAGLADRDTSLLTQPVAGYSWTRGDVKSQMEPVLDIHDVDARPHDFTIEFKPRGSAPSGTILTADFAKNGSTPRYKTIEIQDTDLPKILRVNFADTDFDQQVNNVLSPLTLDQIDSQQEPVIDLTTYADTPTGAQQKADRYMRRRLNGRDTVDLSLTAQQLALEPGDVTTVNLDSIPWNVKLEKQTVVGSRSDCTFRRDEQIVATINSATTGPSMQARTVQVITVPAPIKGFVIDAPFRWDGDQDARPLLYSGAGSYGELAFPGAAIWEETGVGASAAFDKQLEAITTGATWGTCNGALASVPSPWLWDRGNTLNVSLQSGSLTNVAEADIDADPTLNLILVGSPGNWEYINFATATLQGDGTYTLSDFKRGRRGTEWACSGHTSSDCFVMASSLDADEMGTDDIGANFAFKAQAIGRPLDAAAVINVAPYAGDTLKPYAPARIDWSTDGTDMFGTIIRRTRIGGSWVGGSTIPLSEATEAYQIDIYNGSTFKRTISISGTNVFTYTNAQISADGNTVGTPPPVHAYQMSDAVGRGFALAA